VTRPARVLLAWTALILVAAACGDDDDGAGSSTPDTSAEDAGGATTTVPATTVPATTVPATTVPATTVPATTVPATTVPALADVVLEATVAGGRVAEGGGRQRVPLGSTVALLVTSDVDEEIHLHGYDVEIPVVAGETALLEFTADIPGVFEVELHGSGLRIWNLEIS
jgi:hypothetical protein